METAKKNHLPDLPLLGAALFFLLFHFAVWPLVWHGVFLPHVESENHQLRVESYFPHRVIDTRLFLENPDSALAAYAVWQVSQGGLYHLRLSCDDNGKVSIDDRPVIVLEGLSPNNVGETKTWLTPGPHFLELHLNNGPEQGMAENRGKGPGPNPVRPPGSQGVILSEDRKHRDLATDNHLGGISRPVFLPGAKPALVGAILFSPEKGTIISKSSLEIFFSGPGYCYSIIQRPLPS